MHVKLLLHYIAVNHVFIYVNIGSISFFFVKKLKEFLWYLMIGLIAILLLASPFHFPILGRRCSYVSNVHR